MVGRAVAGGKLHMRKSEERVSPATRRGTRRVVRCGTAAVLRADASGRVLPRSGSGPLSGRREPADSAEAPAQPQHGGKAAACPEIRGFWSGPGAYVKCCNYGRMAL